VGAAVNDVEEEDAALAGRSAGVVLRVGRDDERVRAGGGGEGQVIAPAAAVAGDRVGGGVVNHVVGVAVVVEADALGIDGLRADAEVAADPREVDRVAVVEGFDEAIVVRVDERQAGDGGGEEPAGLQRLDRSRESGRCRV
jgi:hypothetical protein